MDRIIIDNIKPSLGSPRHSLKIALGETFEISATVLCDGHDCLRGNLLYRHESERYWKTSPLQNLGNDIWTASFKPEKIGVYKYTLEASIDEFTTWKRDTLIKLAADSLESLDIDIGMKILTEWAEASTRPRRKFINAKIMQLQGFKSTLQKDALPKILEDPDLTILAQAINSKSNVRHSDTMTLMVDPVHAKFSNWYEFFPRSTGPAGTHGNFKTASLFLDYVYDLEFDVVYLPPIHPIGSRNRKGKNDSLFAAPVDVGSPWAIGSHDGGHKAIHPELGTFEDFKLFVQKAQSLGIRVALDIALQCSPDHPYLVHHPEWFKKRADGTIQFAENPPKKYQDIYPFDFESAAHEALWDELKSIFEFWIEHGVTIFRVDNPHTKPFNFWEWLIRDIKRKHPETVFLSEAFTRPAIMKYLAKAGFTQSYTYFTWRTTKKDIVEYMNELTSPELKSYFRPHFWPNTPDILANPLRNGSPQTFQSRLILAATLSSNYGIYGPSFELMENSPKDDISEEYLNSEKYELKTWNIKDPQSLAPLIKKLNQLRKHYPALQETNNIVFHEISNDSLIAYSKISDSRPDEIILTVVNLTPDTKQGGIIEFTMDSHGWHETQSFLVEDILNGTQFKWNGNTHYVEFDPGVTVAHIFKVNKNSSVANILPIGVQ